MKPSGADIVVVDSNSLEDLGARLRPILVVARYGGFRVSGLEPREHAALPSRYITLIVSLGAPIDIIAMPEDAQRPGRFQAFVAGLHAAPARVRDEGTLDLVHVFLTPIGVRSLFGIPAGVLASQVVDLRDLLGPRASELEDRLTRAGSWADRFDIFDDVLTRKLERVQVAREIAWTWRRHAHRRGRSRVRLRRPGSRDSRMERARRVYADRLDRRRSPIRSRPRVG